MLVLKVLFFVIHHDGLMLNTQGFFFVVVLFLQRKVLIYC